jgi:hypothetical protein
MRDCAAAHPELHALNTFSLQYLSAVAGASLMVMTNPSFPWIEANFRSNAGKLSADFVVVLSDGPSRQDHILSLTKLDIDLHFPRLGSGSLFGVYPGYAVKTNLAASSFGYARDGMVAYDMHSGALGRFTLAKPDAVASLGFGSWKDGMRLAAQPSGDSV